MPKSTIFWAGCREFEAYLEGRRAEFLDALLSIEGSNWHVARVLDVKCSEWKMFVKQHAKSVKAWKPGYQFSHMVAPPKVVLSVYLDISGEHPVDEPMLENIADQARKAFTSIYGAVPEDPVDAAQEETRDPWTVTVVYRFGRE